MNLLIQGLQKAGVQTSIKKFSESMKSMEKTTKAGGMDAFRDGMDNMVNFATGFQPIAVPFQILMTQFAASTTESSIGLMNTMMELLQNPLIQEGVKGVGEIVSGLLDGISALVEGLDAAATAITTMNDASTKMIEAGNDYTATADITYEQAETALVQADERNARYGEMFNELNTAYSAGTLSIDEYRLAMEELSATIARWEEARREELEKRNALIEEGRLSEGGSRTQGGVIYDPDEYFLGGGAFG